MNNEHPNIVAAKINARQAILVTVIVGIVSIVTTLFTTGYFPKHQIMGTSGGNYESSRKSGVLDAPHQSFSSKKIDLSLEECMNNAREVLDKSELGGTETRRFFSWA